LCGMAAGWSLQLIGSDCRLQHCAATKQGKYAGHI
jgi:hypothetical protein